MQNWRFSETRDRNENFGSSLLLSNVPMSPKIVNASFAAIYDQSDVLEQFTKTIKLRKDAQDSPGELKDVNRKHVHYLVAFLAMRRRIKGILMSGKQFSLDSRLDLFHGIDISPTQKPENCSLPVVEDSIEPEEKSSSISGKAFAKSLNSSFMGFVAENDVTSGSQSPLKDNLDVPPVRHHRSKSVDHQTNLTIDDLAVKKEICHRCGHKVGKAICFEANKSN